MVAIAGGASFTLAVTSNGLVYAWGANDSGQLGSNGVGQLDIPQVVRGISNAVLVGAAPGGNHSLAVTVNGGTNQYWGWGFNARGQVGNGSTADQYSPALLQFCTRCQRCVKLGTNGTFTAQCNGTLYLYFNDEQGAFGDNGTNSYAVMFHAAGQTNLLATVMGANSDGVAIGAVTNGGVYFYSASGFCQYDSQGHVADPEGNDPNTNQVSCSFANLNITNAVCPAAKCFSLVGKIQ